MLLQIKDISAKWYYQAPYLAEFMMRMTFEETIKCHTIGVGLNKQNHITCLYNKKWIESLSSEKLEGVLVHEINHILLMTHARTKNKNNQLFNIASDMIINHEIENEFTIGGTKLKLPEQGCRITDIPKYQGKLITEDVYDFLIEENKNNSYNYQTIDDHSGLEELNAEQQMILTNLIESIKNDAKARAYGKISAGLQSHLESLLKPQGISLRYAIRKQMQEYIYGSVHKSLSWKKTNRRSLPLPGKSKKGIKLNLVIDTSGSCFSPDIQRIFFSEIEHISSKIEELRVYEFDTEVKNSYKYKKGDWKRIKFTGGGGTDPQPIFNLLHEKKNKYYTICFTDGEFDWTHLNLYNNEVLWAILKQDKLDITEKGLF